MMVEQITNVVLETPTVAGTTTKVVLSTLSSLYSVTMDRFCHHESLQVCSLDQNEGRDQRWVWCEQVRWE